MLIVPAQDEAGGRGGTSSMWAPGGAESKQQPGRGCLRAILEAKRKQLSPLWSGVSAELLPAVLGGAAAISRVLAACRAGCWAVPTSPAIPRGYGQGWAVVTRPVGGKKKIKKIKKMLSMGSWALGSIQKHQRYQHHLNQSQLGLCLYRASHLAWASSFLYVLCLCVCVQGCDQTRPPTKLMGNSSLGHFFGRKKGPLPGKKNKIK